MRCSTQSVAIRFGVMLFCLVLLNCPFGLGQQDSITPTEGKIGYPEAGVLRKFLQAYGLGSPLLPRRIEQFASFDFVNTEFAIGEDVAEVKALNPECLIIGYKDVMGVRPEREDFYFIDQHENWFLHDLNGNRLINRFWGWQALDVGNEEWREYYGNYVKDMCEQYGFDGVHCDDVWEWMTPWHNTVWTVDSSLVPPDYALTWHAKMLGFLRTVKDIIGNRLMILNTFPTYTDYVNVADGVKMEDFMLDDQVSVHTEGYILNPISNKIFIARVWKGDLDFGFGCYLLGASEKSYFGYKTIWDSTEGYVPVMDFDFGNARGPHYVQDNIYIRDFDHAKVLVNLSNHETYSITVDDTSYTLPPHSAILIFA